MEVEYKVRRIARLTLAAETLSFSDGSDIAFFINLLAQEAGLVNRLHQSLHILTTDYYTIVQAPPSNLLITDNLLIAISPIREQQDNGEICICWISKEKQLADCLTKKGVSCTYLVSVLQEGKVNRYFYINSACV